MATAFIPMVDGKNFVDHIDGDKTNNSVDNLRWCTNRENSHFYHSSIKSSSKFVGVRWSERDSIWTAKITFGSNSTHIGSFKTEGEANMAYQYAVKHGAESAKNKFSYKNNATSKYKNVSWVVSKKKWKACIHSKGKTIHLGHFLDEEDANDAVLEFRKNM